MKKIGDTWVDTSGGPRREPSPSGRVFLGGLDSIAAAPDIYLRCVDVDVRELVRKGGAMKKQDDKNYPPNRRGIPDWLESLREAQDKPPRIRKEWYRGPNDVGFEFPITITAHSDASPADTITRDYDIVVQFDGQNSKWVASNRNDFGVKARAKTAGKAVDKLYNKMRKKHRVLYEDQLVSKAGKP